MRAESPQMAHEATADEVCPAGGVIHIKKNHARLRVVCQDLHEHFIHIRVDTVEIHRAAIEKGIFRQAKRSAALKSRRYERTRRK
jgi:hypothetical protein